MAKLTDPVTLLRGVFITMARKQAGLSTSSWATCRSRVLSS